MNTLLYRVVAIILGTHMMSFAWPLRGQFGHAWGAAITGAMAGAIVATLIPWRNFRQVFAQAVFFGTFGFVLGGENIAYGQLIDQILLQPNLWSSIPQLLVISFIGASWGCIGATYLGYGISEVAISFWDYLLVLVSGVIAIVATHALNTNLAILAAFTMLIILLHLYNFIFKHSRIVWTMGLYGLVGFGLGFLGAVILLYFGNKGMLPGPPNWWTLRDQIWGGAGGFGLILAAWSVVTRNLQPVGIRQTWFQRFSFIFFIPFICGINTWDVFQKWFQSAPPAPNLILAGILIAAGVILLALYFFHTLTVSGTTFTGPGLKPMILWSFLFFSFYLLFFAIAKSIVTSGWGVWEMGFNLFLFESLLLFVTMPFILLGPENP